MGFANGNNLVTQILSKYNGDDNAGIDFEEFLKLATSRVHENSTKAEIENVFNSFDTKKEVFILLFRVESQS